jgi:hypothetical protein
MTSLAYIAGATLVGLALLVAWGLLLRLDTWLRWRRTRREWRKTADEARNGAWRREQARRYRED